MVAREGLVDKLSGAPGMIVGDSGLSGVPGFVG